MMCPAYYLILGAQWICANVCCGNHTDILIKKKKKNAWFLCVSSCLENYGRFDLHDFGILVERI